MRNEGVASKAFAPNTPPLAGGPYTVTAASFAFTVHGPLI